jgi:hypothetical protein
MATDIGEIRTLAIAINRFDDEDVFRPRIPRSLRGGPGDR